MTKYKSAIDHTHVKWVSKDWEGYENPYFEVTIKRTGDKEQDEELERIAKSVMADAFLRFATLAQYKLKAEIKQ